MSTTTPPVLQPLVDALNALQASMTANAAAETKLATDIESLLAKVNAGGAVTAADIQPLLDQVNAMKTASDASLAAATSEDQKVTP